VEKSSRKEETSDILKKNNYTTDDEQTVLIIKSVSVISQSDWLRMTIFSKTTPEENPRTSVTRVQKLLVVVSIPPNLTTALS